MSLRRILLINGNTNDSLQAMYRRIVELRSQPRSRAELQAVFRQVWDEQELAGDFEILGFVDEAVEVLRKADGQLGSLSYQDKPRFYFSFIETL
jgi:hypothetical protein